MPDKSKGLRTDFSDEAVTEQFLGQASGLSPHLRQGSATQELIKATKALVGFHGLDALRTQPRGENDPEAT